MCSGKCKGENRTDIEKKWRGKEKGNLLRKGERCAIFRAGKTKDWQGRDEPGKKKRNDSLQEGKIIERWGGDQGRKGNTERGKVKD